MFINKSAKKCFAVALLGLGMFYGCGNDESSVASTFSETDTGKPIAQLDTSLFEKTFSDGKNPCSEDIETDTIHVWPRVLRNMKSLIR